ncbi:MAG: RHS repeat protein [Gammaproteobacteria bacterium]|nr:RHS repeat protein [Gammaproteobacteria bacterium]MCP5136613.1 RHS repeat protein [Gammaproteobacteria bacterium]
MNQLRQPKLGEPAFTIPSGDGDRLFHFGPYGRHLETTDAVTGVRLHAFDYDENGRLLAIRDADDRATTISRDADSTPTAITSPDGQITQLELDAEGWLNCVIEPNGAEWGIACTADGLLTALTTPNGDASTIAYDELGRLTRDTNPAGGEVTLTRSKDATATTITVTDGEGRVETYLRETYPDVTRRRTENNADGSQAATYFEADGSQVRTTADGTVTRRGYAPDPRFGEASTYLAETVTTTPGGLVQTVNVTETATLADPGDIFSVTRYAIDRTRNSVTASTVYDAATRTHTQTSPAGRESVSEIDAHGHVICGSRPGRASDYFSYDAQGRLLERRQGEANDPEARVTSFSYDAQGQLTTLTDAENQSHQFTYDANGRVLTSTRPDGETVSFSYDANGNLRTTGSGLPLLHILYHLLASNHGTTTPH